MKIQSRLVLLQKTMLSIENMDKQLYPQLYLWKTVKPFLENWLKNQVNIFNIISNIKNIPNMIIHLLELPKLLINNIINYKLMMHDIKQLSNNVKLYDKKYNKCYYLLSNSINLIVIINLLNTNNIYISTILIFISIILTITNLRYYKNN
ncbi:MAG: hypothetical protein N4P91_02335 [Candidatus Lightella neohaematopini]|nr:hypothetical protein [Candidatus Lightella neohaematopini]